MPAPNVGLQSGRGGLLKKDGVRGEVTKLLGGQHSMEDGGDGVEIRAIEGVGMKTGFGKVRVRKEGSQVEWV